MRSPVPEDSFGAGARAPVEVSREFLPNIFPCGDQLRALLDQRVRSPGIFVGDVAGHGENVAVLLQRTAGGDACAAVLGGLDDQTPPSTCR